MNNKKEKAINIKDLMDVVIKGSRLEKGLSQVNIAEAWGKMMGPGVQSYTSEVKLQNGTLIVALSSPSLREQLSYGKEKIIGMINEEMGQEVVKRIMLV